MGKKGQYSFKIIVLKQTLIYFKVKQKGLDKNTEVAFLTKVFIYVLKN